MRAFGETHIPTFIGETPIGGVVGEIGQGGMFGETHAPTFVGDTGNGGFIGDSPIGN